MINKTKNEKIIVIYDGVCLFCEGWIKFVTKFSKNKKSIYFLPQQYIYETNLLNKEKEKIGGHNEMIFLLTSNNELYFKSDAIIKILQSFSSILFHFISLIFLVFPKSFRNIIYDLISKNRYKIFGKKDQCIIPNEIQKSLVIENYEQLPLEFQKFFKNYFNFLKK